LERGEVLVWPRGPRRRTPFVVRVEPGHAERRRHTRQDAEGLLIPERNFSFRGPEGKLNLRAHNLIRFVELADGVDDDTWLHHLRRHDYSRWFQEVVGDQGLTAEAEAVESDPGLSPAESRARIRDAIARRYTLPENPSLPRITPAPVAGA